MAPYPPSQRVIARTSDDEDLLFGADGYQRLRNIPMHLSLIRGQPKEPPERGIGVLSIIRKVTEPPDFDGMGQFVGGWLWLPEASHDEIWAQAREHRYEESVIEIEFEPVEVCGRRPTLEHRKEQGCVDHDRRRALRAKTQDFGWPRRTVVRSDCATIKAQSRLRSSPVDHAEKKRSHMTAIGGKADIAATCRDVR